MDLKNLKYFQKVAQLQHITRAANELFISQPALSKVIRQLENELGAALFDRHGKNIDLNENGKLLLDAANQIFQILDDVTHDIQKNSRKNGTNIILSFNSVSMLIPLLISRFQKEYPDISITLANSNGKKEYDVSGLSCFLDSFFAPPGQEDTNVLMTEPCVLACSKHHPLASKQKIQLTDLENEIMYYTINCHSITDLMDYIENINGNHPLIRMECIDPEAVFSFIEENFGIALLPTITWRFTQHKEICYREIEGYHFSRHIKLQWEDDVSDVKEAVIFTEFCQKFFSKISELSRTNNLFEKNLITLFSE